jgi:hypothetical protein
MTKSDDDYIDLFAIPADKKVKQDELSPAQKDALKQVAQVLDPGPLHSLHIQDLERIAAENLLDGPDAQNRIIFRTSSRDDELKGLYGDNVRIFATTYLTGNIVQHRLYMYRPQINEVVRLEDDEYGDNYSFHEVKSLEAYIRSLSNYNIYTGEAHP